MLDWCLHVRQSDWHGSVVDDKKDPIVAPQLFQGFFHDKPAWHVANEVPKLENSVVVQLHDVRALAL
jgi:hypothetical protein